MQINIPKPTDIDLSIDRKNSVIGSYIDNMKSAPFILEIDGEKVFEGVVNRANNQGEHPEEYSITAYTSVQG